MKLHDLHVLMAVAQTGSMGKAAALLNTGQPAVSRSIAELEYALGVRLLDRNRQGVRPTQYGRALIDGGTVVFDELRQTAKNIAFLADPTSGEVRVGCNPGLAASFVSTAADRLSRRYPRVTIRLVTAYVDTLHRELTTRNVDLLIARRSGPILDDRLNHELLFDDPHSIAVGAQNRWARRRRVELADLMNEPWVLPSPTTTVGAVAMEAFRANGIDWPRAAVIADPAEVRMSLLATGRYITIFPNSTLKFAGRRAGLKALSVDHDLGHVPVSIVALKDRTISPIARLFVESAREIAKQLAQKRGDGRDVR